VTQTKIYSLKYAEPDTVVETLKVIVPKEQIGVDKRTNQLAIRANILEHQNVEEAIVKLDREMPQISIEVRIEEVTRSVLDQMGVSWDLNEDVSLDFTTPQINYLKFQKLKLWEEQKNAKLLSKPTVATTDSKEAVIFIGDRRPIAKTTTDAAGNSSTNIDYIDVGTKLSVTPRINSDNIVTVTVKANLSTINGYSKINNNDVPIVRNRETGSVIRLRDGETFMLSGLNQVESTVTDSGVKGFKKIPILGNLFKTKVSDDPTTEIVIFITPRVIKIDKTADTSTQAPAKKADAAEVKPANAASLATAVPEKNESAPIAAAALQPVALEPVKPEPAVTVVKPSSPANNPEISAPAQEVKKAEQPIPVAAVKPEEPKETAAPQVVAAQIAPVQVIPAQPVQPKTMHNVLTEDRKLSVQVKPGDSISSLAGRYGVSKGSIIKDNGLKANAMLKKGQEIILTIPEEHLYRIQPKETLWRISKRFGVTLELLKEINAIEDITKVESGQLIILPVSAKKVVDSRF
jgi:LysM repeat protein